MQEVGLVFGGVDSFVQLRAARAIDALRVMPGGQALGTQAPGMGQTDAELDLAIAQHIGVWRAASALLGEEVREHLPAILGREIDLVQGDAELTTDGAGVLEVLCDGAVGVILVPIRHEQAFDVVTLLPQRQRCDRRVDAARQPDDDLHGVGLRPRRSGVTVALRPARRLRGGPPVRSRARSRARDSRRDAERRVSRDRRRAAAALRRILGIASGRCVDPE